MSIRTQITFEYAMEYLQKGYSIIPCGKDKRPLLKSWKEFQSRQPTEDEVLQWFRDFPEANLAIVSGRVSNLICVDIDVGHEVSTPVNAFPETRTHITPSGGRHLLYKFTEGYTVSSNAYEKYPYVDIRGESGYFLAPNSVTDKGEYKVEKDIPIMEFPTHLFPHKKPRKTLTEMTTASKGNRNDTIASFAGKLLQSESDESKWITEVLPAVERANKTYSPPLPNDEVRTVFDSIARKERERRSGLILSPIQMDNGEVIKDVKIPIRKNGNVVIKDMANVLLVLENHPYYKDTIKYNEFRQEVEYNNKPLEDSDIIKIQYFMQTETGLHGISKDAVYSAIVHYAQKNKYDEAQDWIKSLAWDGTPRLKSWIATATGVEDNAYHQGIGSQWLTGIVRRIMDPGCIFDYMLVIVGPQGVGKTSFFRLIGGKWYKSYTGAIDNKDFYLALRGAIVIDLDEGATLYRSEAIKIKSVITETHDEFRAPYDRIMKKYPRRFVFSMSTNDTEPFRDVTGNRRYWVIDINQSVNFKWIEENRDQLFAEAYHYYQNKIDIAQTPMDEAQAIQEAHLPDDSWTELVADEVKKSHDYCKGDENYSTTIIDVFRKIFPDSSLERIDRRQELRIGNIFRKQLGLERRREMIDGERKNRWYISQKKQKELQSKNQKKEEKEDDGTQVYYPNLDDLIVGYLGIEPKEKEEKILPEIGKMIDEVKNNQGELGI